MKLKSPTTRRTFQSLQQRAGKYPQPKEIALFRVRFSHQKTTYSLSVL